MATTCVYFAVDAGEFSNGLFNRPVLTLVSDGEGPINLVTAMSDVSPAYAPAGKTLICASVVGEILEDDSALLRAVQDHLIGLFGNDAATWRMLKIYRIPKALPDQSVESMKLVSKPVFVKEGLFACGDHLDQVSINGAMASGRRAAEAVIKALATSA